MTESLPPVSLRHLLIPAVHEVVPERFGGPGLGLCAVYAAVTALAASAALELGDDAYAVEAGRVFVRCARDPAFEMSPSVDDGSGRTYHAWASRCHASGRVEIADLATRHFNEWAAASGIPLEARCPRTVWAWREEVPRAFRYAPDAEATARVRESLRAAWGATLQDAAREVLRRTRRDSS